MQDATVGTIGRRPSANSDWFARIEALGAEAGYFRRLGSRHAALFLDQSPILLVTFETVQSIRQGQAGQLPVGYQIAKGRGWSHLCLIADGETWYRDGAVFAYFDQLVDDGFFDGFDQIVFYGAGMAGYAAAAFSAAAPGATVIAVQPQATLDPRVAGWDPRWPEMRRTSFTDRYGYAPDMIEGAAQVFIIHDPEQVLDAMHASLFMRPYVTYLPCRNLGRDIGAALTEMHILPSMLAAACTGTFDARMFAIFYRARRNHRPYLRGLLTKLDRDGRALLAALLCRNVIARMEAPKMKARLQQLENDLAVMGHHLPGRRPTR